MLLGTLDASLLGKAKDKIRVGKCTVRADQDF